MVSLNDSVRTVIFLWLFSGPLRIEQIMTANEKKYDLKGLACIEESSDWE